MYESLFSPWNKKIKKGNCNVLISQELKIFALNSEFTSRNSDFLLRILSLYFAILSSHSQNFKKNVRIVSKKSELRFKKNEKWVFIDVMGDKLILYVYIMHEQRDKTLK